MAFNIYDSLAKYSMGFIPQYQNPANSAMPYLQQVPDMAKQYYNPYIDVGNSAMNKFAPQMESLATPEGAKANYNSLAEGFETNPGTQYAIDNASKQTNQYAAAGGMAGSPTEQLAIADETEKLTYQDFDNYMKMVSGYQQTGFGGESDLMHQGYGASNELAQMLARNLSEQSAYAYAGARNQNQANAAKSSSLWNMAGDAAALF